VVSGVEKGWQKILIEYEKKKRGRRVVRTTALGYARTEAVGRADREGKGNRERSGGPEKKKKIEKRRRLSVGNRKKKGKKIGEKREGRILFLSPPGKRKRSDRSEGD